MSGLIAALERAAREPPGPAQLAALLDAWRIAPNARLVGMIDELSRRHGGGAISKRKAWLAALATRNPEEVPGLLEGVLSPDARWAEVEHIVMLLDGDPDPRFAAAERRIFQRFQHDIRRLDELLAPHRRGPMELPAPTLPIIERVAESLRALHDVESRLRADVFADPHDDTPRMVYADYLQQRGDPLGELIALQLAAAPGTEELIAKLERRVFARSLGALVNVVTSGRLDRGFLAEATLGWDVQALAAVVDKPDWATVRTLTLAQLRKVPVISALLDNPALAGLEQLFGLPIAALVACRGLPALHRLGIAGNATSVAALQELRADAFPLLAEVRCSGSRLAEAVRRCAIASQLERLEVTCYPPEVAPCLLDHGLPRCTLVVTAMGEVATLRDRVLHVRGMVPARLVAMLDAMPPNTFREVHVAERLEHRDYARVGMAAGRHGGLLMEQPA